NDGLLHNHVASLARQAVGVRLSLGNAILCDGRIHRLLDEYLATTRRSLREDPIHLQLARSSKLARLRIKVMPAEQVLLPPAIGGHDFIRLAGPHAIGTDVGIRPHGVLNVAISDVFAAVARTQSSSALISSGLISPERIRRAATQRCQQQSTP